MKKRAKQLYDQIISPGRSFQERLYIILTWLAEIAVVLALICDIIIGESIIECLSLLVAAFITPFVIIITVRKKKTDLGALIVAMSIVFILLPIAYFYGGGLTGGSNVWIVVSFLYIGLLLKSLPRKIMMIILTLFTVAEYTLEFWYPDLVVSHSRPVWYADSSVSVLLVGFLVYAVVYIMTKIFQWENARAVEQAKEIEELNKAQSRFFSSMSHEIRTPINTIIGLNEMILREDISDEVADDARNVRSASKILLSLINDILDMSKIESGKMDIVIQPYDVGAMFSDIVNMIWIRANEKGLKFSIDVDPALPSSLVSDEVRIKQILINLLNNAVKYTEEGSVTLSIHCNKTKPNKVLVTYSVEDTGIGIRKESIPLLFDAFRREDQKHTRYIEGTGLGLSIVKQLADLLGGEVSVNSIYTKGSTFAFTLEQEIADERALGKYEPARFKGARKNEYHQTFEAPSAKVLLVDDNSANLMVATKLLRDTKVQVSAVESAAEALRLTAEEHFNVILMDHMMPEMDGIECLHAIREQRGGLCREVPIVAMTANAGSENQALYRREGFDGYLLKPFEAVELEKTIIDFLPEDIVTIEDESLRSETDKIVRASRKKIPILVTTDSIADIPRSLLKSLKIPIVPYKVYTAKGVFYDGVEAEGDVILKYLDKKDVTARSEAPDTADYEAFFAEQLSYAQNILHISTSKNTSHGYEKACEAAVSFYNVFVFDSGSLSSGTGIMTLAAKSMVDEGVTDIKAIIKELEKKKSKINSGFIMDTTEYLYRGGRLSETAYKITNAFMFHPVIQMKNGFMKVGRVIVGGRNRSRDKYITGTLSNPSDIDTSILFITYVGMKKAEVEEIKAKVLKIVPFEVVYCQKATSAIAINCGPGTFGLLFSRK